MGTDGKTSQPSYSSEESKNYGKADYKAKGVKEYGDTSSADFSLKYFSYRGD